MLRDPCLPAALASRRRSPRIGPALLALLCAQAWGQPAPESSGPTIASTSARVGRAITVIPSASITQTLTDNATHKSDSEREPDSVTQFNAGVALRARTPNVQAALDYQLSGSAHARESRGNTIANSLHSALSANVVDQWLRLDAGASIQQTERSAFGQQSIDSSFDDGNRTEVRSFHVTPSVTRPIGSFALLDARYAYAQQSSSRDSVGDSTSEVASFALSSLAPGRIGWNLSGARSRVEYPAGSLTTDSLQVGLTYRPSADLSLRAHGGREKTDILVRASQNSDSWGVGFDWVPSTRTRLSAQRDERYFGTGHSVLFSHRMQRVNISFSSSRDVSTPHDRLREGTTTLFQLLFANMEATQPDPILREQLVLQRLLALGLNPATQVSLNLLTSSVSVRNQQDLAIAWTGVRSTLSLVLQRGVTERLEGEQVFLDDDLAEGGRVYRNSWALSYGHRLTPSTGIGVDISRSRNRQSVTLRSTDLRSIRLNLNSRFGTRGHWSLGARRVEFDGTSTPYIENAVYATLGVHF